VRGDHTENNTRGVLKGHEREPTWGAFKVQQLTTKQRSTSIQQRDIYIKAKKKRIEGEDNVGNVEKSLIT